jgi:hypothetical protein
MQLDPCWEIFEQLAPQLMRLAPPIRYGGGPGGGREVYWDELTHRWPKLLQTWRVDASGVDASGVDASGVDASGTSAPLEPYVVLSIKWYFSKLRAKSANAQTHECLDELPETSHTHLAQTAKNVESLSAVLASGVSAFDVQLLRLYHVEGHTYRELAEWLSVSESLVRGLLRKAQNRAMAACVLAPAVHAIKSVLREYLDGTLNLESEVTHA